MPTDEKWVKRWNRWLAPKPRSPGVYRLKDGGWLLLALLREGGKRRTKQKVIAACPLHEAVAERARMIAGEKAPLASENSMPLFSSFAASLFARKCSAGDLRSPKTRERWADTLEHHLLPAFGSWRLDELRRQHVEVWRAALGERIQASLGKPRTKGSLSPRTANGWLSILRVIMNAAVIEHELERNPVLHVRDFDTSEAPTYTEEQPNALSPDEARQFLEVMHAKYPQHFPMVFLGFMTALRPSSLRALRRKGESPDIDWRTGVLHVRRSNAMAQLETFVPKGRRHLRFVLPPAVLAVLKDHADKLAGPQAESDLLFPSATGGFRTRTVLEKPFKTVLKTLGWNKHLTPRAMRRTFQDLARAAGIDALVRRAVSGHATEQMSDLYSTVSAGERGKALEGVLALLQPTDPSPRMGKRMGNDR